MLHILTRSPFHFDIKLLFKIIQPSDDILTIQDSIILALNKNVYLEQLIQRSTNLYVLKEHLYNRGLLNQLSKYFTIVDYTEFIELTVKNDKQITW